MKQLNKHLRLPKNNFLFLVMLTFVFIVSSALSISHQSLMISSQPSVSGHKLSALKHQNSNIFPPLPVLGASTYYPILSAQGVLAVDLNSGISLYEKNADAPLLPASTTKIITALVSLDAYPLDSILTAGREVAVDGQKMGLYVGEQMRAEDLIKGLLIYSANDAAQVLAANYTGGYEAFINAMNAKASELSMTNSHFDNPVGLDGNGQRSTAHDLVLASEVAMRNPEFAKIVGTKETVVHDVTGRISYDLKNLNQLLGNTPGVLGIKTGWTESARENLVTYIDRDNHKILIAILGSQDRFGETKELIDWIFNNYEWTEVVPQAVNTNFQSP